MLEGDHVDTVDIEEVGSTAIRVDIFLGQFKADTGRVGLAGLNVIDWQGDTACVTIFSGDSLAQVGGEGGDATLARQVIADEANALDR